MLDNFDQGWDIIDDCGRGVVSFDEVHGLGTPLVFWHSKVIFLICSCARFAQEE